MRSIALEAEEVVLAGGVAAPTRFERPLRCNALRVSGSGFLSHSLDAVPAVLALWVNRRLPRCVPGLVAVEGGWVGFDDELL